MSWFSKVSNHYDYHQHVIKWLNYKKVVSVLACEQALLFGRVKRVSRERASERRSREGPPRSRVLARLTSLTQIGELARRLLVSENGKVQTSWFCMLHELLCARALAKPFGKFIPALFVLVSIVWTAGVKNHSFFCRNGCRPFIEVYNGEQRILTTVQEIEKMR